MPAGRRSRGTHRPPPGPARRGARFARAPRRDAPRPRRSPRASRRRTARRGAQVHQDLLSCAGAERRGWRRSRFATCCTRPFNRGSGSCGPRPVWCRLRPPSVFPCLPANLQGDHLRRPLVVLRPVHGSDQVQAVHGSLLPLRGALAAHPSQRAPRAKSEMSCGVTVSKPTTSSIPGSCGAAIVKPFETMPTTTSRASIPEARRYSSSA